MEAPLLELEGLGKRFGEARVLDDVSLTLAAGEIHCLLGENGAGKSTLCNLVFGVHRPDAGTMRLAGEPYRPTGPADALAAGIAMVHQHFSLVPGLSVVDNLLLGSSRGVLRRAECAARVRTLGVRYGLPLDPDARIDDLSVGERQRVEIVKCLMREPRLLVLDEPTAVLLPDEIQSLLSVCERVVAEGCGVVLVTHKLAEIRRVARRATVLRAGRVVARSDSPATELDGLVRAMIQGDTRPTAANDAEFGDPVAPTTRPAARPTPERIGHEALLVDGLSVRDAQGVERLSNFTVIVAPGEIVGVAGVEGNGQVELADALSGLIAPSAGRYFVGGTELTGRSAKEVTAAGAGIVPEDRHASGCVVDMSVAENLLLNRLGQYRRFGFLDRAAMRRDASELMQRYDVRAAGPEARFGSLSGGNQQKAVLARELTTRPLRFLLAAQPTRGLDVGAVEAVYGHILAACAKGVGVLLVSSEIDDLLRFAHRVIVLYRGRIMGECKAHADARGRIGAWMAGVTS